MMEGSVWGVLLTAAMPFAVLGAASLARRLGLSGEGARKMVHILLSNWILLAIAVYRSAWTACILPACFIPLNYLSYRRGLFSAIEREEDNTPGTVWYAVSLFLLCLFGYAVDLPWVAACGMLAMGYGDGVGALVGKRWGRSRFPAPCADKSLEGTVTVLALSALAVGGVCAFCAPGGSSFALTAALCCSMPAAAIELFSPRGIDNLTLPLGVSLIVFLMARFPGTQPFFACLSVTLLVLLAAFYLGAITFPGLLAALALGLAMFLLGGWISYAALVLFFLLGSAASRIGKGRKAQAESLHQHSGARGVAQVAANGLPSLLFAALYAATGGEGCRLAVIGCFAAAAADTFSSDLGMLSRQEPVSILTFKPVRRGMSGGVTLLGLGAGVLGALLLSLLAAPRFGWTGVLACCLTGLAGTLVDSLLGASAQAKYRVPKGHKKDGDALLTERESLAGRPLELAGGMRWVNNDVVNFSSVSVCGLVLALLWQAFGAS